jgi:hypothetical protein
MPQLDLIQADLSPNCMAAELQKIHNCMWTAIGPTSFQYLAAKSRSSFIRFRLRKVKKVIYVEAMARCCFGLSTEGLAIEAKANGCLQGVETISLIVSVVERHYDSFAF